MGYSSNQTIPWSSGLYDCGDDVANCCVTCYLPCVTYGQIAEIVDKGEISCCKAGVLYGVIHFMIPCCLRFLVEPCCLGSYRTKLRQQYSLAEAPCNDCLINCFCEPCALCQHYRELKKQGFDMSAGWEENLARKPGEMAVPLTEVRMTRDK
ncbi:cell number regulator 2-like [Rhododendron vialii]|uniref:cell number regulator 2-like n=1 Tax=Rhododendron vialii TaxID=182163 RepID=UPI00265F51CC|nr:cell number regulator 2-like [Rhododendron vialii]